MLRGAREEASGYIGMFSPLWTSLVAMRGLGILLRQLDDIMALVDVCMYMYSMRYINILQVLLYVLTQYLPPNGTQSVPVEMYMIRQIPLRLLHAPSDIWQSEGFLDPAAALSAL